MMNKAEWKQVKFGDVVRQVKDKVDPETAGIDRYIAGEHMDTDDLRIRRWGEIGDDYLGPAFHMRFKPGQVLYGSRRTYLRKVAVPHFEGICANTTYVLEPKDPTILLPELLPFIMQTERFHEHSIKQSKGSVNPYINFSDIAWYEFALPPLEEQRALAFQLQSLENYISELHSAIESLWKLLMSDLVSSLDHGEDPFRATPGLPAKWSYTKLGTLIDIQHGYAFSGDYFTEDPIEAPILLTPKNFTEVGELCFTEEKTKRYTGSFPESYWLTSGSLVVLMTDLTPSARLLGAPGIVADGQRVLHNQRIGLVQIVEPSLISRDFLFFSFLGRQLRRLIVGLASGSTVNHTSPTKIRSIPIPLPPLNIQEELTTRWWSIYMGFQRLSARRSQAFSLLVKNREHFLTSEIVNELA